MQVVKIYKTWSLHTSHNHILGHTTSQTLQKQVRRPLLCLCNFYVASNGSRDRTVLIYAKPQRWYNSRLFYILLKGLPLKIASHYSKRNRHPPATYAIQVACQSWNRSLVRGRVRLVRAASIPPYRQDTKWTREGSNIKYQCPQHLCLDTLKSTSRFRLWYHWRVAAWKTKKIPTHTRRNKPKTRSDLRDVGSKEIESHPRRKTWVFCRRRGWLVDPRK